MRGNQKIFRKRMERFQEALKEKDIDAAVIRTLSTFIYLTGTKWLRPSLFVPAEGEPTVFVVKGEAEEFKRRSWIENVVEFQKVEDLMAGVVKLIQSSGARRVGLEFGVERDAYLLFFKMFQRLNPTVEVVDILDITMGMRMIKDEWEIENIRKAAKIANKGMKVAEEIIKPGLSELEIAAEIYRELMLNGSEDPKVYVSTTPRAHAEPFRDLKVKENSVVTVVIGTDWNHYYANMARTFVVGEPNERVKKAIEVKEKALEIALEETKVGVPLNSVERKLFQFFKENGFEDSYLAGYTHGVGLLIEEPPMPTIVVPTRATKVAENMVLSIIHTPLMIPEGAIKHEDTYLVKKDELEKLT
ncbi:aminopeptidase P family protein [Pyrococcus furiosus DSM 3638]|uniref:Proline dipeptidase n=3 Tax=Pyrococcus furiosus TaxID=2261 RepID=Q8U2T3_PYRFU|nr:Xaa-Pro peptidase family protein [Pyrococcus furiosus]AAL80871.1 putative proline dipeptidase [Pyrococcus furiosus DSM 3638]AFN03538.1 proline dipeptidase [Pyrococcus furiosus COM1]QEK78435.1 aminopeptidase P family protein [Pyrococcus furiosus DSM 3638]